MSDRDARGAAPETEVGQEDLERAAEGATEEAAVIREEDLERKESKEAKETESIATDEARDQEVAPAPSPPVAEDSGAQLAQRIGQSPHLPPGLRTRLAEVALAGGSVAAAVRAVEEALPDVLRLTARDVARPAHPAGDVFFGGDADLLAEQQAESLARGQLTRSGLLRGQRARVAD